MRLPVSKKDQKALNLNVYRNLHFFQNNMMKEHFHKLMEPLLRDTPKMDQIKLHYTVNSRTKTRLDIMNVGSIVDKFFSDCLVTYGIIPDDDYKHIVFVSFDYGRIQPEEHVLVTITEIKKESELPMRILLDQYDIQTALEAYVETLGIKDASGVELSVDGDDITAEVTRGEATAKPNLKPKNKGGRPAGSKNKPAPKEPTPDVAKTTDSSTDSNDAGGSEPSGGKPEAEQEKSAETPTPKAEGSKAKNLFGDSPEASSKDTEEAPAKNTDDTPKPVKKSSIFDAN